MHSILIGLSGLVAPGFAHGLMSQRRAMAIVIGLAVACIVGVLFTPWATYLIFAVLAGSAIEAGLRHRRLRPNIRWSWRYALIAVFGALAITWAARVLIVEAFKIPASSMAPTLEIDDHVFASKLAMHLRGPERGEVIVFRMPCMPDRDYIKRVIALENETVEVRCGRVHVGGAPVPTTLIRADDRYRDRYEDDAQWVERPVSRYRETIGDHTFEVFHDVELPRRDEARRASHAEASLDGERSDFPNPEPPSCATQPLDGRELARSQRPGTVVETRPLAALRSPCELHRHYVVPEGHVFVMGDNRESSNDSRYWGPVPVGNVIGPVVGIWYPLGRIDRVE